MIVDGQEEIDDDAFDVVAESLAAYVTLDEWLRTIEPADAELQERIRTEHPEVADWVCGSGVAVAGADAATVRDQLKAGASLDQIADSVATLARTPSGGECLTRGLFRRQLSTSCTGRRSVRRVRRRSCPVRRGAGRVLRDADHP